MKHKQKKPLTKAKQLYKVLWSYEDDVGVDSGVLDIYATSHKEAEKIFKENNKMLIQKTKAGINFNTEGSITMTHQNRADVTTELYLYTDSQLTERYSSSITPIFTATYDELEQGTKSFWLYGRLRDDAPAGRYNGTIQFLTNIESSF